MPHACALTVLVSLLSLLLLPACQPPSTTVDVLTPWSIATAERTVTLHVHASHAAAADSNPGTDAVAPLRTIQRAVDLALEHAAAGEATRILIHPGTYRETVDIADRGETAPPLTLEAVESGTAIISGSDVLADWARRDDGSHTHAWPHLFGWIDNPWPGLMPMTLPGFRRELLFVDGTPQTQVFDLKDLRPGSYLVDEAAGLVFWQPQADVDVASATVEAAVRPLPKYGPHSKLLRAMKVHGLVLRGLVFEHAASMPFSDGAVALRDCHNVIVEDCTIRYNGGFGLDAEITNGRFTRVTADHNGTVGMSGSYDNTLFEHCSTSHNNWRGALFGATGWAPCGFKFAGSNRLVIRDHHAHRNHASGGWLDDSNTDVLIERYTAVNNFRSGLSLEANLGPITIRDSVFAGNAVGINGFDNSNVTIENSTFVDNHSKQVRIAGSSPLSDAELDQYKGWRRHRLAGRRPPENWTFRNTTLAAGADHADVRLIDYWMRSSYTDAAGTPYLDRLNRTLTLDRVTFAHPQPDAPVFPADKGQRANWATWKQSLTEPDARFDAAAYARAARLAARRAGQPITGFPDSSVNLDDPGQ